MRTRTRPPDEPNGWEKSSKVFNFPCTPTEHFTWCAVFGRGNIAERVRNYLNRAAKRKAKL